MLDCLALPGCLYHCQLTCCPPPTPQHMYPDGWRISLGLGGVPAIVLMLGCLVLPDTPNSLIERGKLEEGEKVLQRIRGTPGE